MKFAEYAVQLERNRYVAAERITYPSGSYAVTRIASRDVYCTNGNDCIVRKGEKYIRLRIRFGYSWKRAHYFCLNHWNGKIPTIVNRNGDRF